MKISVSASLLILTLSTTAQAGPGPLRMAVLASEISSVVRMGLMQKRHIPLQTARRSLASRSTAAYKPEHQDPGRSRLVLPRKVQFLDAAREVFIPPSPKRELSRVSPPHIQRENDHTVSVDLK